MNKLYVAYGSNLNLKQMERRCPNSTIYAVGELNNWELVYRGSKTGAHATIVRKRGSTVPVLVWSITSEDEKKLDMYEGYPVYYTKRNVMVNIDNAKKKAMVYIMNDNALPGIPSDSYIKVIAYGYIDNNFDLKILRNSIIKNWEECAVQ